MKKETLLVRIFRKFNLFRGFLKFAPIVCVITAAAVGWVSFKEENFYNYSHQVKFNDEEKNQFQNQWRQEKWLQSTQRYYWELSTREGNKLYQEFKKNNFPNVYLEEEAEEASRNIPSNYHKYLRENIFCDLEYNSIYDFEKNRKNKVSARHYHEFICSAINRVIDQNPKYNFSGGYVVLKKEKNPSSRYDTEHFYVIPGFTGRLLESLKLSAYSAIAAWISFALLAPSLITLFLVFLAGIEILIVWFLRLVKRSLQEFLR